MRLFRDGLTFLALLIVIALVALMVIPRFIDWDHYKDQIAQHITRQAGVAFRLKGALRINLFPQAEIEAVDLEIGTEAEPIARFGYVTLAFTPTALLRGRIQITLAEAKQVTIYPDALLALPERGGAANPLPDAGVDRLEFQDVTFLRANGAAYLAHPITVRLEAPNIFGPYRVHMLDPIAARDFRAQIGRFEAGQAQLKGVIEDAGIGARMVFEGALSQPRLGRPLFDGSVQFNGNPVLPLGEGGAQMPFEGTARLLLEPHQVMVDPISFTLGSGENAASLTGRAFVDLAPNRPLVQLSLSTKRVDPAAILIIPKREAEHPETQGFWGGIAGLERNFGAIDTGFDAHIELHAGAFMLPNGLAHNVAVSLTHYRGKNRLQTLALQLPGETHVQVSRRNEGSESFIDSNATLRSAHPKAFFAFLKGKSEDIPDLPNEITINSLLRSSLEGLDIDTLTLSANAGRLEGKGRLLAPELPTNGKSSSLPQLSLSLQAAQLDARLLGAFALPQQGATSEGLPFTLSLALDIPALMLDGSVIGGLALGLEQAGDASRLKHFRLTGRGGEEIVLSGLLSARETRLSGKIDAEQLSDLARLIAALAPGAGSEALMRRAPALSPARAVVQLTIEPQGQTGSIWVISMEGKVGGTSVLVKNRTNFLSSGLGIALEASLDNPDGAKLLMQMSGVTGLPQLNQAGRVILKAEGDPRRVVETEITATLAGIDFDFSGTLVPFRLPFMLEGRSKFTSNDLSLLHQVLGDGVPYSPKGTPFSGEARLLGERWKVTFTALNAKLGAMHVGGEIAFDFARAGQVAGQIKLKDVALESLLAPAFGADTPLKSADPRDKPLAKALPPLLAGDLWIEAEKSSLFAPSNPAAKHDFDATQFVIRFAPGEVSLEGFEIETGETRYSGTINLRRNGNEVHATGKLSLARAPIPGVVSAKVSGDMAFTATGANHFALLSSLSGAGRIRFEGVTIPQANPLALSHVLSRPLQAMGALNENNIGAQLAGELAKSSLSLPEFSLPYTLTNGQFRLGQTALDPQLFPDAWPALSPSLLLDLPRRLVEARLTMRLADVPSGWRNAAPEISITWNGAMKDVSSGGLRRTLYVSSLVNGLLAGVIQRDLEQAEAFDADVRERAFFLRRFKADSFTRRRIAEINVFLKAQQDKNNTLQPDAPLHITPQR